MFSTLLFVYLRLDWIFFFKLHHLVAFSSSANSISYLILIHQLPHILIPVEDSKVHWYAFALADYQDI